MYINENKCISPCEWKSAWNSMNGKNERKQCHMEVKMILLLKHMQPCEIFVMYYPAKCEKKKYSLKKLTFFEKKA